MKKGFLDIFRFFESGIERKRKEVIRIYQFDGE